MVIAVEPRVGYEKIRLGMSRREALSCLGQPASIETSSDGDESWQYDDVQLSFLAEEDFKLSSITFFSPKYSLQGHQLVGRSVAELKLETSLGRLPKSRTRETMECLQAGTLEIPAMDCTLWIEDMNVTNFTIYPAYSDDGEEVTWPTKPAA
ncbi:MAG: hypothetical protein AAFQ65_04085 [Myxococcota bacterium]